MEFGEGYVSSSRVIAILLFFLVPGAKAARAAEDPDFRLCHRSIENRECLSFSVKCRGGGLSLTSSSGTEFQCRLLREQQCDALEELVMTVAYRISKYPAAQRIMDQTGGGGGCAGYLIQYPGHAIEACSGQHDRVAGELMRLFDSVAVNCERKR